jgi:hypothetical protein
MNMHRFVLVAAGLTAAAAAQVTILDGNMKVTYGPLSPTSQAPRAFSLFGDALAIDHGWESGWYYRIAGDAREFALRNVGGVAEAAGAVHADRDFTDVDARGLLKASVDYDIYDSGPASGVAVNRLTLMNRSNAPVTVDVFCYHDLDIAATFGDDACTGNNSSHRVTDGSGVQVELRALGNDLSAVGVYPTVRDLLTNSVVDDLPGTLPPFNGDYTGAFQWQNRTLQPFEQLSFVVWQIVDTAGSALPLVQQYGAGSSSTFEIHTTTIALQDNSAPRTLQVQMKGAIPGVQYLFLACAAPSAVATPFFGVDLWVDYTSFLGTYGHGMVVSPTGEASEPFSIPPSPYLTGIMVFFQAFAEDAAAPNGFAQWSAGLGVRVGKV